MGAARRDLWRHVRRREEFEHSKYYFEIADVERMRADLRTLRSRGAHAASSRAGGAGLRLRAQMLTHLQHPRHARRHRRDRASGFLPPHAWAWPDAWQMPIWSSARNWSIPLLKQTERPQETRPVSAKPFLASPTTGLTSCSKSASKRCPIRMWKPSWLSSASGFRLAG